MPEIQIPLEEEWPQWAVDAFIHEGKIAYKNESGQVRYKNGKFVKGYSGNKGGVSSNHAQQILRVRSMCLDALENKGLPRIIKELSNKELSAKDLVSIVKFLAEQSMPKQIQDISETPSDIPRIIITKEAFDRAEELDKQYLEQSEDSGNSG